MLRRSDRNIALIAGISGCGKSSSLRELRKWWWFSGLISSWEVVDMRIERIHDVFETIRRFRKSVASSHTYRVLAVENSHAVSGHCRDGINEPLSLKQKLQLAVLLSTLEETGGLVFVESRRFIDWLDIPFSRQYELRTTLSKPFATTILENHLSETNGMMLATKRNLDLLTARLMCNPSEIDFVLSHLKQTMNNWPNFTTSFGTAGGLFHWLTYSPPKGTMSYPANLEMIPPWRDGRTLLKTLLAPKDCVRLFYLLHLEVCTQYVDMA